MLAASHCLMFLTCTVILWNYDKGSMKPSEWMPAWWWSQWRIPKEKNSREKAVSPARGSRKVLVFGVNHWTTGRLCCCDMSCHLLACKVIQQHHTSLPHRNVLIFLLQFTLSKLKCCHLTWYYVYFYSFYVHINLHLNYKNAGLNLYPQHETHSDAHFY